MATQQILPNTNLVTSIAIGRSGYPWTAWNGSFNFTYHSDGGELWKEPNRFALLQSNGYMPPLTYKRWKVDSTLTLGTSTLRFGSPTSYTEVTSDHWRTLFDGWKSSFSSATANNLITTVTAKANGKVRDQKVSIGEILAERKATTSMVVNASKTLTKAYAEVRAKQFERAAVTLGLKKPPKWVHSRRTVSSNWLEYRYGWMPILYSVYGAVELYRQRLLKDQVIHIKASDSASESFSNVSVYTDGYSPNMTGTRRKYNVESVSDISYRVTVGYIYKIENATAKSSSQLGLTNPLLLAWELVPLSFVADWFVNVSDVLAQLDTWQGVSYLSGYRTVKIDEVRTRTAVSTGVTAGYQDLGFSPAVGRYHLQHCIRTVLPAPPSVTLRLQTDLNWRRLLDAVALIKQRFGKR